MSQLDYLADTGTTSIRPSRRTLVVSTFVNNQAFHTVPVVVRSTAAGLFGGADIGQEFNTVLTTASLEPPTNSRHPVKHLTFCIRLNPGGKELGKVAVRLDELATPIVRAKPSHRLQIGTSVAMLVFSIRLSRQRPALAGALRNGTTAPRRLSHVSGSGRAVLLQQRTQLLPAAAPGQEASDRVLQQPRKPRGSVQSSLRERAEPRLRRTPSRKGWGKAEGKPRDAAAPTPQPGGSNAASGPSQRQPLEREELEEWHATDALGRGSEPGLGPVPGADGLPAQDAAAQGTQRAAGDGYEVAGHATAGAESWGWMTADTRHRKRLRELGGADSAAGPGGQESPSTQQAEQQGAAATASVGHAPALMPWMANGGTAAAAEEEAGTSSSELLWSLRRYKSPRRGLQDAALPGRREAEPPSGTGEAQGRGSDRAAAGQRLREEQAPAGTLQAQQGLAASVVLRSEAMHSGPPQSPALPANAGKVPDAEGLTPGSSSDSSQAALLASFKDLMPPQPPPARMQAGHAAERRLRRPAAAIAGKKGGKQRSSGPSSDDPARTEPAGASRTDAGADAGQGEKEQDGLVSWMHLIAVPKPPAAAKPKTAKGKRKPSRARPRAAAEQLPDPAVPEAAAPQESKPGSSDDESFVTASSGPPPTPAAMPDHRSLAQVKQLPPLAPMLPQSRPELRDGSAQTVCEASVQTDTEAPLPSPPASEAATAATEQLLLSTASKATATVEDKATMAQLGEPLPVESANRGVGVGDEPVRPQGQAVAEPQAQVKRQAKPGEEGNGRLEREAEPEQAARRRELEEGSSAESETETETEEVEVVERRFPMPLPLQPPPADDQTRSHADGDAAERESRDSDELLSPRAQAAWQVLESGSFQHFYHAGSDHSRGALTAGSRSSSASPASSAAGAMWQRREEPADAAPERRAAGEPPLFSYPVQGYDSTSGSLRSDGRETGDSPRPEGQPGAFSAAEPSPQAAVLPPGDEAGEPDGTPAAVSPAPLYSYPISLTGTASDTEPSVAGEAGPRPHAIQLQAADVDGEGMMPVFMASIDEAAEPEDTAELETASRSRGGRPAPRWPPLEEADVDVQGGSLGVRGEPVVADSDSDAASFVSAPEASEEAAEGLRSTEVQSEQLPLHQVPFLDGEEARLAAQQADGRKQSAEESGDMREGQCGEEPQPVSDAAEPLPQPGAARSLLAPAQPGADAEPDAAADGPAVAAPKGAAVDASGPSAPQAPQDAAACAVAAERQPGVDAAVMTTEEAPHLQSRDTAAPVVLPIQIVDPGPNPHRHVAEAAVMTDPEPREGQDAVPLLPAEVERPHPQHAHVVDAGVMTDGNGLAGLEQQVVVPLHLAVVESPPPPQQQQQQQVEAGVMTDDAQAGPGPQTAGREESVAVAARSVVADAAVMTEPAATAGLEEGVQQPTGEASPPAPITPSREGLAQPERVQTPGTGDASAGGAARQLQPPQQGSKPEAAEALASGQLWPGPQPAAAPDGPRRQEVVEAQKVAAEVAGTESANEHPSGGRAAAPPPAVDDGPSATSQHGGQAASAPDAPPAHGQGQHKEAEGSPTAADVERPTASVQQLLQRSAVAAADEEPGTEWVNGTWRRRRSRVEGPWSRGSPRSWAAPAPLQHSSPRLAADQAAEPRPQAPNLRLTGGPQQTALKRHPFEQFLEETARARAERRRQLERSASSEAPGAAAAGRDSGAAGGDAAAVQLTLRGWHGGVAAGAPGLASEPDAATAAAGRADSSELKPTAAQLRPGGGAAAAAPLPASGRLVVEPEAKPPATLEPAPDDLLGNVRGLRKYFENVTGRGHGTAILPGTDTPGSATVGSSSSTVPAPQEERRTPRGSAPGEEAQEARKVV